MTGTLNLDSFGNQVGSTGSSGDPYMFAATSRYRNDGDAGLTLVGARYYDGQVGRFISRDTDLDQVPYLYCGHDPVNFVDPDGHTPALLGFLLIPGVAEVVVAGAVAVVATVVIIQGVNQVGDLVREYRRIHPRRDQEKPWIRQGQYRGGPHYDPDPDKRHGGPHIDIPDRDGNNHRYPMPGNPHPPNHEIP